MNTSQLQARLLGEQVRQLGFELAPGPSDAIRFPNAGPYNERFGYQQLPGSIERLATRGYAVTGQARMSPRMIELTDKGLFPIYREKNQGGLELSDCRGDSLYSARYPMRVYEHFESVPPLLVQALLFIENRELLDTPFPTRNPAIEWDRLAKVVVDRLWQLIDHGHPADGGSTLATQIEKYRHSPHGRTASASEKLRQMASASLRAYLDGQDTTARRRQIVVDYLNTVPLAARAGFGEVAGIGDGLHAWYGRDFDEVNRLLSDRDLDPAQAAQALQHRALAFRQALSLMVAQRRPSWYLRAGMTELGALTDSHLRLLAQAGVIEPALRDAALGLDLQRPPTPDAGHTASFVDRKASTALRAQLASLLGVPRTYDLDRLDLSASSTLDAGVQDRASSVLNGLHEPAVSKAAGLYGHNLLKEGDDPARLTFSFTLYERGEGANLLRVQTDSNDQPFDINDGARLDLGSTAKLRTLITYLEIVADLHQHWSMLPAQELGRVEIARRDALGQWAKAFLSQAGDRSLRAMLDAAMQRRYSASPAEGFFTGGGLHRFDNFDSKDDHREMTVREALRHSVNLVFVRMMRDVVHHHMFRTPGSSATLLDDRADPQRQEYLARFADKEGREFITRFYRKYRDKTPQQIEELLLQGVRASPERLASVFLGLEPEADADGLATFIAQRLDHSSLSHEALERLLERNRIDALSLADRGYLAGVHPLEIWVAGYLRRHAGAPLSEVFHESSAERQAVYGWLFRTRNKNAQDVRIRSLLEIEAFLEIQQAWQRLGYPFESLTPSYATALGASGDRPSALAELMGIIVNQGMRLPVARIDSMVFARDTPYETHVDYRPPKGERVLPAELAQVVRDALVDVVEAGTARRLNGALRLRDGSVATIGGKTGTGDHRFDVYGRSGQLISSRVVNRTATFVFLIGDRYFGTIMAYVSEPYAARYKFTSALPTQLLKSLVPALLPMLEDKGCDKAGQRDGPGMEASGSALSAS